MAVNLIEYFVKELCLMLRQTKNTKNAECFIKD